MDDRREAMNAPGHAAGQRWLALLLQQAGAANHRGEIIDDEHGSDAAAHAMQASW